MKEIPVPADAAARERRSRSLKRVCTLCSVAFYILAALAAACLLALLITVLVFELGKGQSDALLYLALGVSFAGGAVLGVPAAFGFARLSELLLSRRTDYLERCDGEESFTVGEGTLATFGETALTLHGKKEGRDVTVPYAHMRIFSVCTRRSPRERGKWSVLFGIPARYLAKNAEKDTPLLVQADAKERLYRAISAHGLNMEGERPQEGSGKRFKATEKFSLPDGGKRRKALILLGVGAVAAAGGIATLFFETMAGSMLVAVGLAVGLRAVLNFTRARRVLALYEEGIFFRVPEAAESEFLKWEQIWTIKKREGALRVECAYGAYEFPEFGELYEELSSRRPDKCGGEE